MGPVMSPPPPFLIRPGTYADIAPGAELFARTIGQDDLMLKIFPAKEQAPAEYQEWIERMWRDRFWTLGWRFDVISMQGEIVALSWWNRGVKNEGVWRRWFSPTWWFAPVVRFCRTIYATLFPLRTLTSLNGSLGPNIFTTVMSRVSPTLLTTPRRKSAWYLSTLAVAPTLQGMGLGRKLLLHGLEQCDREGAAAWLVRLQGTQKFYEVNGFKEVGTVAVEELEGWDGGQVMFRE